MILPSPRLIALAAVLAAVALAAALLGAPSLWAAGAAGLALLAAWDAWAAARLPVPVITRRLPGAVALGVPLEVILRIANPGGRALRGALHDHHPATLEAQGLPRTLQLPAHGWAEVRYRVRPLARGEARFAHAELRIDSPLRLWQATRRSGEPVAVRVYPNFQALARYTLLATDHRLAQLGVLQVRRRGEGTEFHQLREYRQGDPQRAIDWKASARTARLVSREYEEEKDQRVLLLIDCGRRMGAKDDVLSHFDHTLNAALLLAHVAARQGDAVGMMTLGGVSRYLEPRKSLRAVHALLNAVYDIEPTLAMPDYEQAAREVMRRMRRRTLVLLLTNVRDEDDATLAPALGLLRSRHLVVLASLREAILGRALSARVDSFERAVTHAAAAEYLAMRERVFRRLQAEGVLCLDVEPARLPIALVNRYLDIKRQGRL